MHNPAQDSVAGYPGGSVLDKDANPETTLGSAYSPVDYMSITSFPRLPEDDTMSGETTQKSRKDDDNVLSEQDTGGSGCVRCHYAKCCSLRRCIVCVSIILFQIIIILIYHTIYIST